MSLTLGARRDTFGLKTMYIVFCILNTLFVQELGYSSLEPKLCN